MATFSYPAIYITQINAVKLRKSKTISRLWPDILGKTLASWALADSAGPDKHYGKRVSCRTWEEGEDTVRCDRSYPDSSLPLAWDWPAMASIIASWEYMLMGVLYCAWMMVALPPGPFTSMGLLVESAVSLRAIGLKLGRYSVLCEWGSGDKGCVWVEERQER